MATFNSSLDLKSVLNNCKPTTAYTKISELREECPYKIVKFERVTTQYGETITAILEGQQGEDLHLRVYLPKRFNEALSDRQIEAYNSGRRDILHLVKKTAPAGSKLTPLEFV